MHALVKRLRLPENWLEVAEKSKNVSTRAIAACASVDIGRYPENEARQHFDVDETPYARARSVIEMMPNEIRRSFDGEKGASIYTLWEKRTGTASGIVLAEKNILFREFVSMLSPEALHAAWRKQAALMSSDRGFDPVKASRFNEIWQKIRTKEK